ncbi:hypothetical protein P3L10_026689 [Capsicum annuum]|uniref:uncharacterized protein LOC107841556 n=1 Tax=Capsicum annuum TaxID=4072 RepID=UPI0007BFCE2C|nr:uncharacterized protein LOC107841556 [Capsicum annuum]
MNAQSNTAAEATSSQRNVSASGDSSCNNGQTLIFLTSSGLEPSSKCSSSITLSFKSEVDPNKINWKGVSQDVKDGYFGEFKNFYWDASVSEVLVKQQWMKKATLCYNNFITNIKKHRATVQPEFINNHVCEKWMELWQSDDCIKKSKINSKNHCGGHEVAAGTHTSGSITAGEHRKKLLLLVLCYFSSKQLLEIVTAAVFCYCSYYWFYAIFQQAIAAVSLALKIGRHPTPSELHLHVHTHNHDEKSFVGDRSRLLHERYEEIIWEKGQCESEIDQLETYYEAAGGAKKNRLFGLGSEATSYFGKKLVQDGAVLDPPPTHDNDDDIDL